MIILKDRCFFIVPQGADSILSTVIRKLVDGGQNTAADIDTMTELPFELRALEATLATVIQQMEAELSGMKSSISESLKLLRSSPSDPKAQTELFLGSGKLNSFEQRANAVVEVLENVLEQPDNLAFMSLTRLFEGTLIPPTSPALRSRGGSGSSGGSGGSGGSRGGSRGGSAGGDREEQHRTTPGRSVDNVFLFTERNGCMQDENVELLLENYLSDAKSLARRVQGLAWKLTSTSRIIEIELAAGRNRLLRVDVWLEVISVVAALCAMFAGLFGMNLKSGLELENGVFWMVFGLAIGCLIVLPLILSLFLKRLL
jgi:hypothetical protein